jgi:hypothetical protein
MFALTPDDLSDIILDCAAGPASFNAELTVEGHWVTSCNPLFRFTADEIRSRIDTAYNTMVANVRTTLHEFVWRREFVSPEHLGEARMAAMGTFLADFPQGMAEGRYLDRSLPHLGFRNREFDLALCSHFLFTYSDRLSVDFHVAAIEEMCRVADEARVFPLLKSYGGPSPHLKPVVDLLRGHGCHVEVRKVPYEFQRGGDEMLVASGD